MTRMLDPYQILEVEPGASEAQIRESWRDLVQVWHPDRFSANPRLQSKAARKMQQINEAYDALRNGGTMRQSNQRSSTAKPSTYNTPSAHPDPTDPERVRPPLDVLREGVDRWNLWRNKYSSNAINLASADLRGLRLSMVNFGDADLRGASLQEADLYRANLSGARCNAASFHAADLSRASLVGAELTGADLVDVDLSSSVLTSARLTRAKLHNANLVGCDLRGVDLRQATGLNARQLRVAIVDSQTRLPVFA